MKGLLHLLGIHAWSDWYLSDDEAWQNVDNYIDLKKRDSIASPQYKIIKKCKICGKFNTMFVHKN